MKFIFPQNYNFKNKLFGVISYSTLVFNALWYFTIFSILQLLFSDWNIKISLLISLAFPITLFSIIGLNGESIFYIFRYIIRYIFKPKLYVFKKF